MHNLALLCRHHHRLMHEGGFAMEHRGHGVLRFLRPHGKALPETVPRAIVQRCPQRLLVDVNRARDLRIDDRTGVSRWDGVPMDEAAAVEGVLAAGGEFEF